MTAHDEDGQVRLEGAHLLDGFEPRSTRHRVIEDGGIDAVGRFFEGCDRFRSGADRDHAQPRLVQTRAEQPPHGGIVFGQQDARVAGPGLSVLAIRGSGPGCSRPPDLEGGALPGRRDEIDAAVVRLDDAVDHGETQPGTGPDGLRREERIEDAARRVVVDAGAVIGDDDLDRTLDVPSRELDAASRPDRVAGVHEQVREHALELRLVRLDGGKVRRDGALDAHLSA